jgi:hypothetical protein
VHAPIRPPAAAGVLAVDDDGDVVHHLTHHRTGFRMITSVCAVGDLLILGSVRERGVAVCEAPAPE